MSSGLGFYVTKEIASVLLPGVVVLTELTVLAAKVAQVDIGSLWKSLGSITGAGLVLLVILGVSGAYVIGYLTRELGFMTLLMTDKLLDRFPTRRRTVSPSDWVLVRRFFGDRFTDDLVTLHPVLRHLDRELNERESQPDVAVPPVQGSGVRKGDVTHSTTVFTYNKNWLRQYAPLLGIEHMEIEVNILLSTLSPVGLLAGNILVASNVPLWLKIAFVPITGLICYAILKSAIRVKRAEPWAALLHLGFDMAMRTAQSMYPTAITTGGANS